MDGKVRIISKDELILISLHAMKKLIHHITVVMFVLTVASFLQGCASFKKNGCGCPNKKGMVGY